MKGGIGSKLLWSFASTAFAGLLVLMPAVAAAQQSDTPSERPNTGQDVFEPPQNLFLALYGYQTKPGSGMAPGSLATTTTETTDLRVDHRIDLSPQSLIVLRGDLPLVITNPISGSNPGGDYLGGLGDADVQAIYAYNFDSRWAAGGGARLIAPTGGDTIGSGKWQIMPIVGFRYGMPEVLSGSYLEPFARYDASFAGDHISLSLEIGVPIVKDYPVYDFKAQIRLNVTY